jgi:hypothetical protein
LEIEFGPVGAAMYCHPSTDTGVKL